jgi:hypothetical protein
MPPFSFVLGQSLLARQPFADRCHHFAKSGGIIPPNPKRPRPGYAPPANQLCQFRVSRVGISTGIDQHHRCWHNVFQTATILP